jgi:non-specific serine/threonine protein kinase
VAWAQGDHAAARPLFEESLAIRRELGDRQGIAESLNNLGEVAQAQGDHAAARALHEESLAIRRELGHRWGIAVSLNNLGTVAWAQGDHAAARALYEESLAIKRELGDKKDLAECLEGLAKVAGAQGQPQRAARLLGAAEALREAIGAPLPPADRSDHERSVAAARAALGEEGFGAAWEGGRVSSLEQAIEYALGTGTAVAPPPTDADRQHAALERELARISRREQEVAALIAQGLSDRQIAERLVITEGTAGLHVVHILDKLGFHARAQVAAWALQHGLVAAPPT